MKAVLKKLFTVFVFVSFILSSNSAHAKSKNFFSQLLKAYQDYEEANILLWLTGDVGAEKRLGKELQMWQKLTSKPESNKAINDYVKSVFDRLVPQYNFHGMKPTITVLHDKTVNAFAIPGCHIYIYTGMLDLVQNDDELAAVLAHELSHSQMRHSLKNYRLSAAMVALLKKAVKNKKDQDTWGTILNYLVSMGFSRKQEDESDDIGQSKLAAAGFNPAAQINLWERMLNKFGDTKGIQKYLSSHPTNSERIANAKRNLAKMNYSPNMQSTSTAGNTPGTSVRSVLKAPVPVNLIPNGDFEASDLSKWEIISGNFTVSKSQKHSGNASLESKPAGNVIARIYSDYVAVGEKSSFIFNALRKSEDGNQPSAIGFDLYDSNKKLRNRYMIASSDKTSKDWLQLTTHIVNTDKNIIFKPNIAYIRIFLQTGPCLSNSVWFDEVSLTIK